MFQLSANIERWSSDLLKGLEQYYWRKDVSNSFPFIYLCFCKHNHLGKSQKTGESLPIRAKTLQVAPKGNFVCRCRAGGVRSSPVRDTLLRLTVYPPALARNNDSRPFLSRFAVRELLMQNLKIPS